MGDEGGRGGDEGGGEERRREERRGGDNLKRDRKEEWESSNKFSCVKLLLN